MKLKFLLQKNAWFIEHKGSWYTVRDEEQRLLAASTLPLVVVDQNALIAQPHLAGIATLVEEALPPRVRFLGKAKGKEPVTVRVTLTEPDGTPVVEQRVTLDRSALVSIEWLTAPFEDGWLHASTSLSLDNVRKLELQAYLPGAAESPGKAVTVHNQTDGVTTELWLERDRNNVIPLIGNGKRGTVVLRLECEPELMDASNDSRQLGFVLVGESVEAA